MKNLNIQVKETNNKELTLYLDNNNVGIIKDNKQLELDNQDHSIYIRYGDTKSKDLKLKGAAKKDYFVEVTKTSSIIFSSPLRILRILILLFIMSFCSHKAIGIGYYVFTIATLLITVIMYLNWNKLILREIKN